MTLEWGDPPEATRRGKWSKVFKELQTNPGVWAKLSQGKARNCYSLAGRLRKVGAGDYEFTSRTTGESEGETEAGVWGRYIGHLNELEAEIVEVQTGADHEDMEPEELPDPV